MSSEHLSNTADTEFAADIEAVQQLLSTEFEKVELAYVRLKRGDPPEYEAGRLVGKFTDDLELHYRGHTQRVDNARQWELIEFEPIRSSVHKQMVASQLDGYDG